MIREHRPRQKKQVYGNNTFRDPRFGRLGAVVVEGRCLIERFEFFTEERPDQNARNHDRQTAALLPRQADLSLRFRGR